MKWVTREQPKVDRIACPWLIKRFVDPTAEFLYAPRDDVLTVAEREGATSYDIRDADLGHHGDECSFDAIVRKYDLDRADPALARLARIVRGADAHQRDLTPESAGGPCACAVDAGLPRRQHRHDLTTRAGAST